MLRPKVYIQVLNNSNYQGDSDSPVIKYTIKPSTFSSEETREGISVTFVTKSEKKILKVGDKIQPFIKYENIFESEQWFPVLIVTDTQINSDGDFECIAIDEFAYYCRIITFIPDVETSKLESDYLKNTFGVTIGQEYVSQSEIDKLSDINFKDLLGYIQLRIYKLMYYSDLTISDEQLIKFKNNLLFNIPDYITTSTVGKWTIGSSVPILDVLKILKDNYMITIFQENSSYYQKTNVNGNNIVTVEVVGTIPSLDNPVKITDNVNIIKDNLKYKNPSEQRKLWIGEYINFIKDDKGKINKKESEKWYGYYDNENKPISTKTKPSKVNFLQSNKYSIGNANSITENQRQKEVLNKVISNEYLGYEGSIDTFQYACILSDVIELKFNNSNNIIREFKKYDDSSLKNYRVDGKFGISSINRSYDSSGLFMTINVRQQLTI